MREGVKEEKINDNTEISSEIFKDVLNDNRKRKVEDSIDCRLCKTHVSAHIRYGEDPGDMEGDRRSNLRSTVIEL